MYIPSDKRTYSASQLNAPHWLGNCRDGGFFLGLLTISSFFILNDSSVAWPSLAKLGIEYCSHCVSVPFSPSINTCAQKEEGDEPCAGTCYTRPSKDVCTCALCTRLRKYLQAPFTNARRSTLHLSSCIDNWRYRN